MTIYLATAPKSNSAKVALGAALAAAQETPAAPVPLHIRNAPTGLMKELGYGKGYRYAHDSPDAYLPQEYLPDAAPRHRVLHAGRRSATRRRWPSGWRGGRGRSRRRPREMGTDRATPEGRARRVP